MVNNTADKERFILDSHPIKIYREPIRTLHFAAIKIAPQARDFMYKKKESIAVEIKFLFL
jgi:hypothetical protein